ncbi:hypothetical protein [Candidatus Epulonipiscium viviparus]|uniref:hypothetical protein n=1 Tax=Candidatus Epulonipiscium viviparus TaxID=420336 RepID=UPI00016BFC93|nr:hypothetical protein [Candidatus Epulopiscium viviparus]
MGLKKHFIKNYLDFKIVEDSTGLFKIYSKRIGAIKDKDDIYIDKVVQLFEQINGVDSINVSKSDCIIEVIYNPNILNSAKLQKYIDLILDLIIENSDLIKTHTPNNTDDLAVVLAAKFNQKAATANI